MKTFGEIPLGAKFQLRNTVSGEVRADCPVREKIETFQWKSGKGGRMNATYRFRGRTFFEWFEDHEEVVPS